MFLFIWCVVVMIIIFIGCMKKEIRKLGFYYIFSVMLLGFLFLGIVLGYVVEKVITYNNRVTYSLTSTENIKPLEVNNFQVFKKGYKEYYLIYGDLGYKYNNSLVIPKRDVEIKFINDNNAKVEIYTPHFDNKILNSILHPVTDNTYIFYIPNNTIGMYKSVGGYRVQPRIFNIE